MAVTAVERIPKRPGRVRSRSNKEWSADKYEEVLTSWIGTARCTSLETMLGPFVGYGAGSVTHAALMRTLPLVGLLVKDFM